MIIKQRWKKLLENNTGEVSKGYKKWKSEREQ